MKDTIESTWEAGRKIRISSGGNRGKRLCALGTTVKVFRSHRSGRKCRTTSRVIPVTRPAGSQNDVYFQVQILDANEAPSQPGAEGIGDNSP